MWIPRRLHSPQHHGRGWEGEQGKQQKQQAEIEDGCKSDYHFSFCNEINCKTRRIQTHFERNMMWSDQNPSMGWTTSTFLLPLFSFIFLSKFANLSISLKKSIYKKCYLQRKQLQPKRNWQEVATTCLFLPLSCLFSCSQINETSICSCSSSDGPKGHQAQWRGRVKERVYRRGRKCLIVHFVENAKCEL